MSYGENYVVRSYTPEYGWMREFVGNRKDAVAEYLRLKSIYDIVEIEKMTIATHNRVAKAAGEEAAL